MNFLFIKHILGPLADRGRNYRATTPNARQAEGVKVTNEKQFQEGKEQLANKGRAPVVAVPMVTGNERVSR